jgi:HEAT repeats
MRLSHPRLISLAALAVVILAVTVMVATRHAGPPLMAPPPSPILGVGQTALPDRTAVAGKLRPELAEAVGRGAPSPWNRRTDIIRNLPANLTEAEVDALLVALMEPRPPKISAAIHSTYIHEIATILHSHNDIRQRFFQSLATLARDTQRDDATRDYAIQHLRWVWSSASDERALRGSITATFRELCRLDPVVATPALLSLHLLGSPADQTDSSQITSATPGRGNAPPPFDLADADLLPLLQPIFAAPTSKTNIPARLTAVRIVGERRLIAFRPPLLVALHDRSEHTLVRMAAASALAQIGDPSDLEALATLDAGDERLASAVRHALRAPAKP